MLHKVSGKCPATSDTKICVHHGGQVCHGDSGGPLLVNQGGMGVLIGVLSYIQLPTCPPNATSCALGERCKESSLAVFIKVQAFLPWIKKITGIGEHQPFLV